MDINRENVARFGEIFTPSWLIDEMLTLVVDETNRFDSRFLEPSCGDGRVLYAVLYTKLKHCKRVYAKNAHNRLFFSFVALSSIYGVDIQAKNVKATREKLLALFLGNINKHDRSWICPPAQHVISKNILLGDTLAASAGTKQLLISQWSPIGTSHIQRQDFYFENLFVNRLTGASDHSVGKTNTNLIRPADEIFKSRRIVDLPVDA